MASVQTSVRPPVYPSAHLSVRPSVRPPASPPARPSVCPSVYVCARACACTRMCASPPCTLHVSNDRNVKMCQDVSRNVKTCQAYNWREVDIALRDKLVKKILEARRRHLGLLTLPTHRLSLCPTHLFFCFIFFFVSSAVLCVVVHCISLFVVSCWPSACI